MNLDRRAFLRALAVATGCATCLPEWADAAPGMTRAGKTSDSPVGFVDIFPTLCDLAGLAVPDELQGMSLRPILDDPTESVKHAQLSQYPRHHGGARHMGYSLRSRRYRATFWFPLDKVDDPDAVHLAEHIDLYDDQTDPNETRNLADDADHADRIVLFRTLLEEQLKLARSKLPAA